jgi:hypothetical protein
VNHDPPEDDALPEDVREAKRLMAEACAILGMTPPPPRPPDQPPLCTFCGTGRNNTTFMFSGRRVAEAYICAECIEICHMKIVEGDQS